MASDIVPLEKADQKYGGKAAGLAKLFAKNLPVPEGVALHPKFVSRLARKPSQNEMASLAAALSTDPKVKYAVRSSALSEDGEANSFAGVYDTVLNVSNNPQAILSAVQTVLK